MSKKILIVGIVILVIIILVVAYFVAYSRPTVTPVENESPVKEEPVKEESIIKAGDVQVITGDVGSQTDENVGVLSICKDECGDGVCQSIDPNCGNSDLNCICLETVKECPQDCK